MSLDVVCPDDRMVLVRRGAVDDAAWKALLEHVRICDDCRAVWLAARAFDQIGRTEPMDERVVDRAAAVALATLTPPRTKTVLRSAFVVAATLTGAVAVASAGISIQRRVWPRPTVVADTNPAAHSKSPRRARAAWSPVSEPELRPVDDDADQPKVEMPSAPTAAPPSNASAPSLRRRGAAGAPAAVLFARATAARRSGRFGDAIGAFRQLEREHPASPEAVVSLVSLGELLAETAEPDAALVCLDTYLRRSPPGPLVPEALAAKARLLARLGRWREAQRSHDELERRFPHWLYTRGRREDGR